MVTTMKNSTQAKVLVIHALRPTSRQTTIDHLLSFREHLPEADVQYLHFQQPLPKDIGEISPDLLIVNYDYLNYRFSPLWPFIKNRHKDIAQRAGKVVAIAQDDFWANKLLDNWCMDWDVDRILTASEGGWELLYPRSHKQIEICESLTGYSKSTNVPNTRPLVNRQIDVGQRVREMPAHLGRVGQLKAQQASEFGALASSNGFVVDVSTRVEDAFLGEDWLNFLASCRFTIGMKGGASVLDPYGLLHTRVESYRKRHQDASYYDIERACFRRVSQSNEFVAVSPRLFEAARAGTCQILPPANYLNVLEPWEHYIPLNQDLSNTDEVFSMMRNLDKCQLIADNAREVLVNSGNFDYSRLVTAATKDLLEKNPSEDFHWKEFCEYIDNCNKMQLLSLELHDFVQSYILTVLHDRHHSQLRCKTTLNTVSQIFDNLGVSTWLDEQIEFAKSDKGFKHTIWTWRNINREQ